MGVLQHLLTVVVPAVVLRWLWTSSNVEQAKFDSGRQLFPGWVEDWRRTP